MAKPELLQFARPLGGVLLLQAEVVATIAGYAKSDTEQSEAGGVLLGRLILGTRNVTVDRVTEPASGDKRSRFHYWRSRAPHQKAVDQAWKGSTGTCNYLGEWHCHPEDDPHPSKHDLGNWTKIVNGARYEQTTLLFVIAGYKRVRVWELDKASAGPIELTQLHDD